MNVELLEFTRRALEKGAGREQIGEALRKAGWGEADIRSTTGAFADIDFPTPVPMPRPYLSAQDVFTYALSFTALYISAYNLGALAFHFIDLALPDPASANLSSGFSAAYLRAVVYAQMRGNIAALIVAFPLFLFLFRMVRIAIARDPTKRESRPRKWLTYLTLFIAAAALLGDLSALIYNLLGGELTTRFLLEVLTIGLIAGGAFGYFLIDVRKDERA